MLGVFGILGFAALLAFMLHQSAQLFWFTFFSASSPRLACYVTS
jgi:hypothetical protein